MDYKKAIEALRPMADNYVLPGVVDALETAIRAMEDLPKVRVERDAAVDDIAGIIGDIEEIRQSCSIDNADADGALADLCCKYCAASGGMCYKEGPGGRCENFCWRGSAVPNRVESNAVKVVEVYQVKEGH